MNPRLATETYPGQPQVTNTYDWVGNKTSLPGSEYNAADQLTSTTGHTYTYDGRGNMTSDNSTQYTYTPANLLATAGNSSMTWDAAGNRITFTSSTDTSNPYTFVYDPTAGIPAIIEESHAGTSIYYVREPGGALIARVSGTDVKYYGFDDLGSTLFLTDITGIVTDKYTYDAWGNSTSHTGCTNQPYQYVGRLGYYTHWQDANFGLLQLGERVYNSVNARFTQQDPIREGFTLYAYVLSKPTKNTDPTGLSIYACAATASEHGPVGHAWMCIDGKCRGCYLSLPTGRVLDDTDIMKDEYRGIPAVGQCIKLDDNSVGSGFSACLRERLPEKDSRCLYIGGTNCTTWASSYLWSCGCGSLLALSPKFPYQFPGWVKNNCQRSPCNNKAGVGGWLRKYIGRLY